MTEFEKNVFNLVKKIPKGKVATYQILAKKLGNIKLARAVGNALPKNSHFIIIPCHRVVKTSGKVGNYVLGVAKKIKLLHNEGIRIKRGKIADLAKCLYYFN
ncbi:MAG: MGMT family protein [Candidatus Parcubacteria bacterium]|nr:MGMT family protein [Candidatus Parcubacteria bacterium]